MNPQFDDEVEIEPIEENGDQPVTSAEFHQAMRTAGKSFESVESNIAEIRAEMATKDDLQELEDRVNAKIAKLATKDELAELEERLVARMDAQVESMVKAVTRQIDIAVDRAVQRHFQQHIKLLEERISRLEEFTGFSSAA